MTEDNKTLSPEHLHQLEEVLSSLLANQEMIIDQNRKLLNARKMELVWKVIKAIIFILIVVVPMFFLPQIISKMTQEVNNVISSSVSGQMENINLGEGFNGLDALLNQ